MKDFKPQDRVTSQNEESDYYGKPGTFNFRTQSGLCSINFNTVNVCLDERDVVLSRNFKPKE